MKRLMKMVLGALCIALGFAANAAMTASGVGFPVTVTVKDWTGKVVTTVRGVTFDGNFTLDTADHFNGKVDYVTAFDGGTVVKNGTNSERASSSVVNYSGISGESFATEVFVQPYVPTADGYALADPFGVKVPNENRWLLTGTTGSSIKLALLTSFPTALNSLALWSAKDVSNFADGYSSAVRAPEVLYVKGNWYVYFSASTLSDTAKERSFVMSYKGSGSSGLTTKSNWNQAVKLGLPGDLFGIDGTVFEGKDGKLYYVWSGWEGNANDRQDIYLAPMDTPTSIAAGAKRTLVSKPDQSWETQPTDYPLVEEGPAVLQKGDKTIIVFSGNGSWKQYYSLGYTVCSDGNYTNADSWKKHEGTVFTKRSFAYGPGHCSFTKDANGLDYIIYHATPTATAPSGSDYGSIRTARLQPFAWHNDEPVFGAPRPTSGTGLAPAGESYDVTKSWTKAGSADKTFVHAPTAVTVTGRIGSPVSPSFLENDYFTVSGMTSLAESKTVTLTLTLKDTTKSVWDDGTTANKRCEFTASLTGDPPREMDPIGVCSWSWHEPMTNIIRRMEANGFKGIQLALSPWVWEGEGSAAQKETFGDQEGEEVFNLISNKCAKGELDIHATMICFSNEDYTTEHTISNTCGFYYGLAPSASEEQKALADLTWEIRSNQFAKAVERTRMLGVRNITAHIGLVHLDDDMSRLYWACKTCQANGCKLLVETGMYSAEEEVFMLDQFKALHPDAEIGLNFDMANQVLYGADNPTNAYAVMKDWIGQVHVKDCVETYSARGSWATDVEWGRGDVSRTYNMIDVIKADGFAGPMLVEHESGSSDSDVREREILTAVKAIRGDPAPVVAGLGEVLGPYLTAVAATNAARGAEFTPSTEVAAVLGEDAAAGYCAKFGFAVEPAAGGAWAVTAALRPEARASLAASATDVTRQIPVAAIAVLADGATLAVTATNGVPGFYYTLHDGAVLTGIVPDADAANRDVLCGANGKVAFPAVGKPSAAAGFFRVGVDTTKGSER